MLDGSSVLRGAAFVVVISAAIATSTTTMQTNPRKAIAKRFMALRIQNGIVVIKNAEHEQHEPHCSCMQFFCLSRKKPSFLRFRPVEAVVNSLLFGNSPAISIYRMGAMKRNELFTKETISF